jgi:hypothetical protein
VAIKSIYYIKANNLSCAKYEKGKLRIICTATPRRDHKDISSHSNSYPPKKMKPSSVAASRSLNKRPMQNSPTRPSKPKNQPINQYFASKKPNQSASPARTQKEAATDRIPVAPDEIFYDPLQMEMEIDDNEDDVSAASASKQDTSQQSDELSSSAESSGILHPVIQRNVNSDQTFASSKEDTHSGEESKDSQQQAESEYQQQDMEDQQRQPSERFR